MVSDVDPTTQARDLYNAGRAAYRQHDYEKAQVRFFEAFALKKHWQIAGNLGDAEMRLQIYADAAAHWGFAVRTGQIDPVTRGAAARDLDRIRKGLEEAKKQVVTLEINVEPSGSQVLVDAKPVGTSPLEDPIFLSPGPHRVEARGAGVVPASYDLDGLQGSSYTIRLQLDPAPQVVATPPSPAKSTLAAAPPAQPDDYVPPQRRGSNGARTAVLITEGTLTVTAAILAGIFTANAASASDRMQSAGQQALAQTGPNGCATAPVAPGCVALRQATDDHNSAKSAATIAWTSAGALGLVTLGTFLFWPNARPADAHLTLVPALSSTSGGMTIHARF